MSVNSVKTTIHLSKEAIYKTLWERGDIEFIFSPVQKELLDIYSGSEDNATLVWLLARQTGKTYALAAIADMTARKYPKCIVNILTDTKLHMEEIILPKFDEIYDNAKAPCPEELRPRYEKAKYKYHYPNGSIINLAGADGGHFEKMRGKKAKLNIVDEAGFCDKLGEIVMDVLLPTTTHTGGKIILSSTPPKDFDHDFNAYVEAAELEGYLTKKTLFDNTLLTKEQIDKIIKRYPGGVTNRSFRREYLCEMLKDPERSVFPEVDDEMLKVVVREYPKPMYYTPYVGMDIGFKDLTVVLFGYHDFKSNKIVIEREIVKNGSQLKLKEFTEEILKTEEILWTNTMTGELYDPKTRTSDIEPIVTQEIYNHSGAKLYFTPVRKEKGYKLPLINHIRMMLCDGLIVINPKCRILINHLKNAKWANNQKDDFTRSPGNEKEDIPASHYDAADALLYMIKGMDLNYNPVPRHARGASPDFIRNPSTYNHGKHQDNAEVFRAIFGKKNRKK